MRKLLTILVTVVFAVALGTPALASTTGANKTGATFSDHPGDRDRDFDRDRNRDRDRDRDFDRDRDRDGDRDFDRDRDRDRDFDRDRDRDFDRDRDRDRDFDRDRDRDFDRDRDRDRDFDRDHDRFASSCYGSCYGDGYGYGSRDCGYGFQPEDVVVIRCISFNPPRIRVRPGDEVVWSWQDYGTPHTVTADDGSFESGRRTGGEFRHVFDHPGRFTYHCRIHPDRMFGEVVVTP